ncbi:hypothetical protein ACEQPO_13305 [Bacillus sp. SL00103]
MKVSGCRGNEDIFDWFVIRSTSFYIADGEEIQIAPYNRQFGSKNGMVTY